MAIIGVDEVPLFIFSSYPGTEIFRDLVERKEVQVDDAYFLSLISLNGKFSNLLPEGVTARNITRFELATLRLGFMLINYTLSYVLYPKRIIRTVRNLFDGGSSATVLENRLQDALKRRRVFQRED